MILKDFVKKHLAEEYDLNFDDVEELYLSARETVQEGLIELKTNMDKADFQAVAEAAHALKGNLLNMGLEEAAALAREMEMQAKKDAEGDLRNYLKRLELKIETLH